MISHPIDHFNVWLSFGGFVFKALAAHYGWDAAETAWGEFRV